MTEGHYLVFVLVILGIFYLTNGIQMLIKNREYGERADGSVYRKDKQWRENVRKSFGL